MNAYINTIVEVQVYKTFIQQNNSNSIRYILSKLATEFLSLYRNYRLILLEAAFNQAYSKILERTQRNETIGSNSDSDSDSNSNIEDREANTDNKVNILVRLIESTKVVTTITRKDTLVQQLKIVRYLEKYQQVYKEKYVKVQLVRERIQDLSDRLLYYVIIR